MQLQYSTHPIRHSHQFSSPTVSSAANAGGLARIAPGASAFDIRTFECAGCHHVYTATVKTGPMKLDAVL
jgi:hypothetical protein